MTVATHIKNDRITLKKRLTIINGEKSTPSFTCSLRYCKDIIKLLFWVLSACLAMHTQSDTINLQKIFVFICRKKNYFIAHAFPEILQRYANLFWLIWASLVIYNQNDSINFQKTSMFMCMPKVKFTSSLKYYILKNLAILLANSIWAHNWRPRILPDMGLVLKYQ